MLDGLEEDIQHPGFETEQQLWRYCYRVASTVGLTCVAIWGTVPVADGATVRDMAIRRGQAFQRTNILRDFAQDFDCTPRRLYLPREALARHGLTADQVRRWQDPEACRRLILEQAAVAREFYRSSEGLERLIDPACAPTLWAMTKIYAGLLDIVETDPERIVRSRRVRLASARKAGIALAATWRARRGRW
jgi:phytoene synthase